MAHHVIIVAVRPSWSRPPSTPGHQSPTTMQQTFPDLTRLAAPFPAEDVEWKPGATTRDKSKGLAMAYITARAVQERLDEVFGPGNWKNEFRAGPDGGVLCRIYFKNEDGEWVWREDGADNTDVEAVKGGLSNAMKRAGAALGIGLAAERLGDPVRDVEVGVRTGDTPQERWNAVLNEGLRIRTTFDLRLQRIAERTIRGMLDQPDQLIRASGCDVGVGVLLGRGGLGDGVDE